MLNKVCKKCHKRLTIDNFVKDSSKKDGLYSSCKDCYRERTGGAKRPDWHGKVIIVNGVECRWCQGCHRNLDCDLFYKRTNNPDDTRCKECVLKRSKGRENSRIIEKKHRDKLRSEIIFKYSNGKNCCNCCGETEIKFLSLDHIDGGGNRHRYENKGKNIYRLLKQQGYPEGFQILCHNCNLSKGFYGKCPHKKS